MHERYVADAKQDNSSQHTAVQTSNGRTAPPRSRRSASARLAGVRTRGVGVRFAADDVDVDVAAAAGQLVDERAAQQFAPAGLQRLADDDLGDVALPGVGDDLAGRRRRRRASRPRRPAARPGAASRPAARGRRAAGGRRPAFRRARRSTARAGWRPSAAWPAPGWPTSGLGADADQQPLGGRPRLLRSPGPCGSRSSADRRARPSCRRASSRRAIRLPLLKEVLDAPARPARAHRPCPRAAARSGRRAARSTSSISSACSKTESGTVSRTTTPVICATTSFRLSRCWTLSVV